MRVTHYKLTLTTLKIHVYNYNALIIIISISFYLFIQDYVQHYLITPIKDTNSTPQITPNQ